MIRFLRIRLVVLVVFLLGISLSGLAAAASPSLAYEEFESSQDLLSDIGRTAAKALNVMSGMIEHVESTESGSEVSADWFRISCEDIVIRLKVHENQAYAEYVLYKDGVVVHPSKRDQSECDFSGKHVSIVAEDLASRIMKIEGLEIELTRQMRHSRALGHIDTARTQREKYSQRSISYLATLLQIMDMYQQVLEARLSHHMLPTTQTP